jgi:hypothetical protein
MAEIRINHSANLKTLITQTVKGAHGIGVAFGEAINNCFDASATSVKILQKKIERNEAIVIMDDGDGFNKDGVVSALSYADSSRERNDTKTIGANGTGLKSLLGLGDLSKTKVTIFSVSAEYPNGIELSFDFNYLVQLADKKITGWENVNQNIDKVFFFQNWKRVSGTTVIITGYDTDKIKDIQKVVEYVSRRVTPRAAEKLFAYFGNDYYSIEAEQVSGNQMDPFEHSSKLLGNVTFDMYYGGTNDGPVICGPVNSVMPFSDFFKVLSRQQKDAVTREFNSVGGFIYIEKLNKYRDHDGSFTAEFEKGACQELVQMCNLVADELKNLNQQVDGIKLKKQHDQLVKDICKLSREFFATPTPTVMSPSIPKDPTLAYPEQDYYILPKNLRMKPKSQMEVTLNSKGKKDANFKNAKWKSDQNSIRIFGTGHKATVHSGEETTGKIEITGSFGTHLIDVVVSGRSLGTYIDGNKKVLPGQTYEYELCNSSETNIVWSISNAKGVVMNNQHGKKLSITIPPNEPQHDFLISCKSVSSKKEIAKRTVYITEEGGFGKQELVTVGKQHYLLEIGAHYIQCIAQLESAGPGEHSTIVLNPIHESLKNVNSTYQMGLILQSVAMAGCVDQVEQGIMSPQQAMLVSADFVTKLQAGITKKVKNKTK